MRTVVVLVVAVAVLAAAGIYGALLLTRGDDTAPDPETTDTRWESYVVRGRTLVVQAVGDPCTELADVAVEESGERVVVTMRVQTDASVCTTQAVPVRARVRLEEPLGSRPVYDGACLADEDPAKRCRRGD